MIGEVAAVFGGDNDPVARDLARVKLDRAADRLNMAGIWAFRRKEETYTLTDNQESLTLPADFSFPTQPTSVYEGTDLLASMEWKTYDVFQRIKHSEYSGVPNFISILSPLDGVAYIFPHGSVGYTLKLNYWARLQRPSEAQEIALIPEAREAMISQGIALMAQHRHLTHPAIWRPLQEEANRVTAGARNASQRWLGAVVNAAYPDLDGYAVPSDIFLSSSNSKLGIGPAYIKIA
jgi:hypothetical protein